MCFLLGNWNCIPLLLIHQCVILNWSKHWESFLVTCSMTSRCTEGCDFSWLMLQSPPCQSVLIGQSCSSKRQTFISCECTTNQTHTEILHSLQKKPCKLTGNLIADLSNTTCSGHLSPVCPSQGVLLRNVPSTCYNKHSINEIKLQNSLLMAFLIITIWSVFTHHFAPSAAGWGCATITHLMRKHLNAI